MSVLSAIWWSSLAFAAASVIAMALLIVRRILVDKQLKKRAAQLDELTMLILQYLEGGDESEDIVGSVSGMDAVLVGEVASELLIVMHGENRTRLVELLEATGAIEDQLRFLRHGNGAERIRAATILGAYDKPEVVEALHEQLGHRSFSVGFAAAKALVELKAIASVRDLVERLEVGTRANSRALRIIFRNMLPDYLMEMIELLHEDVPAYVKALTIDALGRSGNYQALETLMLFATNETEPMSVRVEALRAIALLEHPAAQPAVAKCLDDTLWPIRTHAAVCAGRIGLIDTLPRLSELLDDSEWWVRLRAGEALYALGERGIAVLERVKSDAATSYDTAERVLAEKRLAA